VTKILVNLPREYQRWNKYYKQQWKSITPKTSKQNKPDNDDDEEQQARPFDVSQAIPPTFKQAIYPKTFIKKHKGLTSPLILDESWDPLIVTQRLMKKQYDIRFLDMNKEPIESYRLGEKLEKKQEETLLAKPKKHRKKKTKTTKQNIDHKNDRKPQTKIQTTEMLKRQCITETMKKMGQLKQNNKKKKTKKTKHQTKKNTTKHQMKQHKY
jgi:hypothetical protein